MIAKLSGQVMEIKTEYDEKNNRLATVTAVVFQRGERSLVTIKKVPSGIVKEGHAVSDLPIRANSYNFNGNSGMSVVYAE